MRVKVQEIQLSRELCKFGGSNLKHDTFLPLSLLAFEPQRTSSVRDYLPFPSPPSSSVHRGRGCFRVGTCVGDRRRVLVIRTRVHPGSERPTYVEFVTRTYF